MTNLQTDVAVIGAGAAGLAAARSLHERGVDALVLEARGHVGGRARTLPSYDGAFPVELGAEFIHGAPPSTLTLMREFGFSVIDAPWGAFRLHDGRLEQTDDVSATTAGVLQRADLQAPDQSVEAFLHSAAVKGFSREQLAQVRSLVEGFDAAITTDASIIGIATEWRSASREGPFRPEHGYGAIMERLAGTVQGRILLNARVRRIDWLPGAVRIAAERFGEALKIRARRVVVTLPIGVLRAQSVTFAPDLPDEKRRAIDEISMGPVVKVMLVFRSSFWEQLDGGRYEHASFFSAPQLDIPTVWTRLPQRVPLLVAWAGGGAAQRIIEKRLDPIVAAIKTCQALFPSVDVWAQLANAYYHDWQNDEYACGAYSYLRVGAGAAREQLGAPIQQTLFFAGEATCAQDTGTVAGAFESGYRTAHEIMAG